MKKILIVFSLLVGFALTGCEDFLDTKNLTKRDTSNYPQNEDEVQELLTGAYRLAREAETAPSFARGGFLMAELMSDDRFGGAGDTSQQDLNISDFEKFINSEENAFAAVWDCCYRTIFRTNTMIEGLALVDWSDQSIRDYAEGQGLFLRSYVFFYLARMFGTAPMPMASEPANLPRSSADEIFGQVAADLVRAIELMPNTPRAAERGRATKWAAEALLARAFLFYTGYYNKDSIVMAGDAGTLTKADVIEYLDDCIANSGYSLLQSTGDVDGGGFYSLWPYSNEITREHGGYKWLDDVDPDKKVVWAGEEGGNVETIFAWQFAASGGTYEGNLLNLFFGMRMMDYNNTHDAQTQRTFPFGSGWGFGTVNSRLWDSWPDNDPRKKGSIIDINDPLEATGYIPGADNWQAETGYFQKKYMPILFEDDAAGTVTGSGGARVNISKYMYPAQAGVGYNNNNTQDLVMIRFADVLLMAAELKGDAAPLNQVRARVGLPPVAYSLEALQNERRWELAFEGIRWFDMLRWGLDYAGAALNSQNGVPVTNSHSAKGEVIDVTTINYGDQAAQLRRTGGFFPIPQEEIEKSGGVLVQTEGW